MKKVVIIIFLLFLFSFDALAQDEQMFYDQLHASGADNLSRQLPYETQRLLRDMGLSDISYDSMVNFTPSKLGSAVLQQFKSSKDAPLKALATIAGIIMLCALLEGFKLSFGQRALGGTFNSVSALCIAAAVIIPILNLISRAGKVIEHSANFMLSFIPVFAGIMVTSGQPVTAGSYNLLLFAMAQAISNISSRTLVPMMSIYLAFCIVSALSPSVKFTSTAQFMQKAVTWALAIMLTVFVGILTVQGVVGNAADTVAVKTAKFAISGSVPVVGSIISDATNSVQSCVGLLKSTVGAYGIIAAGFIYLPVIVELIIWLFTIQICSAAGDMFEVKAVSSILKSAGLVIKVLLAIIITILLMLIVSTTIMLALKGGI